MVMITTVLFSASWPSGWNQRDHSTSQNGHPKALRQNIPVIRFYTDPSKPEYKAGNCTCRPALAGNVQGSAHWQTDAQRSFSVSHSRPADFPFASGRMQPIRLLSRRSLQLCQNGLIISIVDINSIKIISSSFMKVCKVTFRHISPNRYCHRCPGFHSAAWIRWFNRVLHPVVCPQPRPLLNHSAANARCTCSVAPTLSKVIRHCGPSWIWTELKVAGTKWTDVGRTECRWPKEFIRMKNRAMLLRSGNHVERDGWASIRSRDRMDWKSVR